MLRAHRHLPAAIALSTALALSPVAMAQNSGSQAQQPSQSQGQSTEFSQDQIESYAAAATEIRKISADYQPQIQAAASPQERENLQREATDEMVEAVESEGLTVESYNQITSASQSSPELAEQIAQHMQQ